MPRVKVDDTELNVTELEEAEYEENEDFEPYQGPIPPKNTVLTGYVSRMWWTFDRSENRMIKILWIAADNVGDKAQYNGLSIFDNDSLTPVSKWRWAPMMRVLGFSLADLKKKLYLEDGETNMGEVIEKIGAFIPGEENDVAWCRVLTGINVYEGNKSAQVQRWMDWADPKPADDEIDDDDEAEEIEPEEAEEPEEPDPDDDGETPEDDADEDEPEEAPAPPKRPAKAASRPAAAKPAAASSATAAKRPAAKPTAATAPARGRSGRAATADAPF
jgi:hypothetical protein